MGKGTVNNGQKVDGAAVAESDLHGASAPSLFGRQTASEAHQAPKPDLTDIRAEQDLMFPKNARSMAAQPTTVQAAASAPPSGASSGISNEHHNGHRGQAVREDTRIADVRNKEREVRRNIEAENNAKPQESIGAAESRDLAMMRATRGQAPKGTSNSNLSQGASANQLSVQAGGVAQQIAKIPLSAENVESQMKLLEEGAKSTHDGWSLLKNLIPKNKENEAKVEEDMKKVREQYAYMKAHGLLNNQAEMQKLLSLMIDAGKQVDSTKTAQAMGGSMAATVVTMAAGVVVVGAVSIAAAPIWVTAAVAVGVGFAARAGVKYLFKGRDEDKDLVSDAKAAVVDGAMVFVGGKLAQGVAQAASKPISAIVSKIPGAELGAQAPTMVKAAVGAVRASLVGGTTGAIVGGGRAAVAELSSEEERQKGLAHGLTAVGSEASRGFVFGAAIGAAFGALDAGWGDKIRAGASALFAKMTGASPALPAKAASAAPSDGEPSTPNSSQNSASDTGPKSANNSSRAVLDDDGVIIGTAERSAGNRLLRQALGEPETPSAPARTTRPAHDDLNVRSTPAERNEGDRLLRQALDKSGAQSASAKPANATHDDAGFKASEAERTANNKALNDLLNTPNSSSQSPKPSASEVVDDLFANLGIRVADPKAPNPSNAAPGSFSASKPASSSPIVDEQAAAPSSPTPAQKAPVTDRPQTAPKADPEGGVALETKAPSASEMVDDLLANLGIKDSAPKASTPSNAAPGNPSTSKPAPRSLSAEEQATVDKDLQSIFGGNKSPNGNNPAPKEAPQQRTAIDEGGGSGSSLPKESEAPKITHAPEKPRNPAPGEPALKPQAKPAPKTRTATADPDEEIPLDQWQKDYAKKDAADFLRSLGIKVRTTEPETAPAPKPAPENTPKPEAAPAPAQQASPNSAPAAQPKSAPAPKPAPALKTEPVASPDHSTRPMPASVPAPSPSPQPQAMTAPVALAAAATSPSPAPSPAASTKPAAEPSTKVETAAAEAEQVKGRLALPSDGVVDEGTLELADLDPTSVEYARLKEELRKIRLDKNRYWKMYWKAGNKLAQAGTPDAAISQDFDGDGISEDPILRPFYLTNKES